MNTTPSSRKHKRPGPASKHAGSGAFVCLFIIKKTFKNHPYLSPYMVTGRLVGVDAHIDPAEPTDFTEICGKFAAAAAGRCGHRPLHGWCIFRTVLRKQTFTRVLQEPAADPWKAGKEQPDEKASRAAQGRQQRYGNDRAAKPCGQPAAVQQAQHKQVHKIDAERRA